MDELIDAFRLVQSPLDACLQFKNSDQYLVMKPEMKFPFLRTFAVIIWCLTTLGIALLALLPVEHLQLPELDWWDKAQHALAFAVLTGWAIWLRPRAVVHAVLGMLIFGAVIELAEWAVGWRFAAWADRAADAVGVLLAWGLTIQINKLNFWLDCRKWF